MLQRVKNALFKPRLQKATYVKHFRRALQISGHSRPADYPLDADVPDFDARIAAFQHRMQTEHIPFFTFAPGQCLNSSLYLSSIFSDATGLRAWLTLGQLWFDSKPIFYLSHRNARRLVRSRTTLDAFAPAPDGFTFHVWITLESGAIFDSTVAASISARHPGLFPPGSVVLGHPETALPNHAYVPLLVGQGLIERIVTESRILGVILHHIRVS